MAAVLDGVRVLDFTQGMAGGLATMILADYGAEVIRFEPPGGDPMWSHPAYLVWNRGKKSVDIDLTSPDGAEHVRNAIRHADILIESLRPGEADAAGFGHEVAAELNPAIIYCSISAFGQEGPYKNLRAYDGIVNAKAGRMRDQVGWYDGRPIYRAVNDTSYHTAMFTVQATLAALRVVSMTGRGQRVNTSLLRGVTAPNNPWRRFEGERLTNARVAPKRESDPLTAQPWHICTECKDGRWIMHAHVLSQKLFRSWISTIDFEWIWDDPRYKGSPNSYPTDQDRIDLNRLIIARMKEKTSAEWIELYMANPDCCGEVMQTTHEVLHHPQFVQNGHLIELDDPRVGRIEQVGALVKMSATPAVIDTPAPLPGQHTAEVLAAESRQRAVITPTGGNPRRPLEGIVILELAMHLAAPFGGALLADLGARVIKIEPLSGDPLRTMATNENGIRATQGKESLAVDLKSEQGRAILHRLVVKADVLVHNFREGVAPRLAVDDDTLREIKPDLVYLYAGSYGSSGPNAKRAAFNPTMGALTGNSMFQSGEGNSPLGDQSPDPIAGSAVATAVMLGLTSRLRTGEGQYMETTMMNSIVYCNSDDALDYSGKPPRRNPDTLQLGLEATYRLYETRAGWVFLAAPTDAEFTAFCSAAECPQLAHDERFATAAERYSHRAELGDLLEPVFAQRTADEWEQHLTAADVGCVRADGFGHRRFLHEDPHTAATGFMVPTRHWLYNENAPDGVYWRHGPVADFSETPCASGLPYAAIGEHTRDILDELGFDADQVDSMKRDGVVTWPEDVPDQQPGA